MSIIDFFYILLCSFWMPMIFQILLRDSVDKKHLLIGNIISTIILCIASLVVANEISLIIACLAIVIVFLFCFKVKKILLLYIPVAYVITVLCNFLVECVYVEIVRLEIKDDFESVDNLMQVWLITVTIFILTSIILFIQRKIQNKNAELLKNREFSALLVGNIMLCTLALLINNWIDRKNGFNSNAIKTNLLVFVGYLLLSIVISLIAFKVYNTRESMRREKEQYESLKEYTNQIEIMYQSIRGFKHDYVNILNSISGYLEDEKYDELKNYFYENIMKESKNIIRDDFKLNQLSNIKDLALKGLMSSKLIYAHELGIEIVIDIMDEINTFYINSMDLSRIIGIYFDNAIEAALEFQGKKQIRFNVVKEENSVALCLMNTFVDKQIPLSKLEKNGFSTKGEGRGTGLYNAKEVLKRYRNVTKSTSIKDGFFIQSLIFQK